MTQGTSLTPHTSKLVVCACSLATNAIGSALLVLGTRLFRISKPNTSSYAPTASRNYEFGWCKLVSVSDDLYSLGPTVIPLRGASSPGRYLRIDFTSALGQRIRCPMLICPLPCHKGGCSPEKCFINAFLARISHIAAYCRAAASSLLLLLGLFYSRIHNNCMFAIVQWHHTRSISKNR